MSNERRLSDDQIAEAIHLRAYDKMPWQHLATRFCVDVKTIRRHCDPRFDRTVSACHESYGTREQDETHKLRMWGDRRFKLRCIRVRRQSFSEAAHLIPQVITSPGTQYPRLVVMPGHVCSVNAIADC